MAHVQQLYVGYLAIKGWPLLKPSSASLPLDLRGHIFCDHPGVDRTWIKKNKKHCEIGHTFEDFHILSTSIQDDYVYIYIYMDITKSHTIYPCSMQCGSVEVIRRGAVGVLWPQTLTMTHSSLSSSNGPSFVFGM